jgi:hypothetical protein
MPAGPLPQTESTPAGATPPADAAGYLARASAWLPRNAARTKRWMAP